MRRQKLQRNSSNSLHRYEGPKDSGHITVEVAYVMVLAIRVVVQTADAACSITDSTLLV